MLGKSSEEPAKQEQSGNRIKLPEESGIRSVSGFKEFLAMAESSKGSQIELSWTTKIPGQRFVLDMQWDANQKAPFWTLYEENNHKSKRLWNEPLPLANIDLCYDVLVMTCGAVDPSTKNLADILKAQPEKIDWGKSSTKPNTPLVKKEIESHDSAAVEVGSVESGLPPRDSGLNNAANQNPGFPAGYPAGYMVPPPGMAMPIGSGMGLPMPGYNVSPNIPAAAPFYPANINPANQGFPASQTIPPNAWQQGSMNGNDFYGQPNTTHPVVQNMPVQNNPVQNSPMQNMPVQNSPMQNMPMQNMPGQNSPMQNMPMQNMPVQNNSVSGQRMSMQSLLASPTEGSLNSLPVDSGLFNKQDGISLVDLLVKAELITETALAAALKIQELIQEKVINLEKAAEVLKHQHNKGHNIHNYLDLSIAGESAQSEGTAVFELLKQAGLISKADIELARTVIKKHGGDIAAILQAANKLDAKTFEAAKICYGLQKHGLMKLEQSVIVLNYCSRSRVTFDEALSELKWVNPRKQMTK